MSQARARSTDRDRDHDRDRDRSRRDRGRRPGDDPQPAPWSYTPAVPLKVTTSSSLTEDWIRTQDVLVLPDDSFERSTVAAYRQNRNAASEALVVGQDSRLYQVTPDQTTESGWAVTQVATSGQVGEVVAGPNALDPTTAHAFYATGSATVHLTRKAGGGWTQAGDKLPTCSGLRYTSPPLTGELIAYGVDADGDLQIVRQGQGAGWTATSIPVGVPLSVGVTLLQMVDDDTWSLATRDDKTGGLTLFRGTTKPIGDPVHVAPPVGRSFSKLLFAYSRANAVMFLAADDQGALYTVDFQRNVVPVPGAQAAQGTAVLDAGLLHFYGVSADGTLSALHQHQWTSIGPSWVSAIPVDQGIVKVVTDGYPRHGAALFAVDAANRLRFYSQDMVTAAWTPARVQRRADAEPYNLPQYRTEITVIDDNGNPAPNVQLTLTADSACTVSVGSESFP